MNQKISFAKQLICIFLALTLFSVSGCSLSPEIDKSYGVFLSVTENIETLGDYETVVIDAQYFTADEILSFKAEGHTVYSYLNIGSLETFREYYNDFKSLALCRYENWEDEDWIDASDERWRSFIIDVLAPSLIEKGIDGFFVDNCDVYYEFTTEEIFDGVATILRSLVETGKKVIINGGDCFVDAYCSSGNSWKDIMTGINQETVFTRIIWNGDRFSKALKTDREYFRDYIERYAGEGAEIFLLEYTKSVFLTSKIAKYCREKGFRYYISDSIELD